MALDWLVLSAVCLDDLNIDRDSPPLYYILGNLQCVMGWSTDGNFRHYPKGHWQSSCAALTAGNFPADRAVQWDRERVLRLVYHNIIDRNTFHMFQTVSWYHMSVTGSQTTTTPLFRRQIVNTQWQRKYQSATFTYHFCGEPTFTSGFFLTRGQFCRKYFHVSWRYFCLQCTNKNVTMALAQGFCLNIKISPCQYRAPPYGDKTILRTSYLRNVFPTLVRRHFCTESGFWTWHADISNNNFTEFITRFGANEWHDIINAVHQYLS